MTVVRAACRCTLPVLLFARWLGGTVILAPLTIDRLMLAHLQVSLYYLQNDLINGSTIDEAGFKAVYRLKSDTHDGALAAADWIVGQGFDAVFYPQVCHCTGTAFPSPIPLTHV